MRFLNRNLRGRPHALTEEGAGGRFLAPLDHACPDRMPAPVLRLLLLPFEALGDEASLGVWARQLPQLLSRSLLGLVVTIAPLWRDARSGRLVRSEGALPQTVIQGEGEAAEADWVLMGAVAQTDEGLRIDLKLQQMAEPGAAQAWRLPFAHGNESIAFATLVGQIAARLGNPHPVTEPPATQPLWPLLCDLEVEAELQAAGIGALTQPSAAWSHLRDAALRGHAAWASPRLAARRALLQRIAPELLEAFDTDNLKATDTTDLSTDEVLLLLGISSTTTPPSTHG